MLMMVPVALARMSVTPVPFRPDSVIVNVLVTSGMRSGQIGTLTVFAFAPVAKLSVPVNLLPPKSPPPVAPLA